jgi:hypothetical protein
MRSRFSLTLMGPRLLPFSGLREPNSTFCPLRYLAVFTMRRVHSVQLPCGIDYQQSNTVIMLGPRRGNCCNDIILSGHPLPNWALPSPIALFTGMSFATHGSQRAEWLRHDCLAVFSGFSNGASLSTPIQRRLGENCAPGGRRGFTSRKWLLSNSNGVSVL